MFSLNHCVCLFPGDVSKLDKMAVASTRLHLPPVRMHAHAVDEKQQMEFQATYPDLFSSRTDGLVDSPRRILAEQTMMAGFPSPLSASLDYFYEELAELSEKRRFSAVSKTDTIVEYIMPRIKKLGNQLGMKITGHVNAGSTFDDTQVILPYDIDIFVLFERFKTKIDSLDPGYKSIPLRRYRPKVGSPPDQWRYGRSEEGRYLSSLTVAKNMYDLVERALKLHPQTQLEPFLVEDGKAQITVVLKKKFRINLIPATRVENEDMYLITRPYSYDQNPISDKAWRMSFIGREKNIMEKMDQADRGMRRKAFKVLKALVKVEPTLQGLTSYHVKTTLLHTFDSTVDRTPRWQRSSLETCFLNLLQEMHYHISMGNMPHFFVRSYNLLGNIPRRTLATVRTRVEYLLANHNELVRILRKRAQ